MRKFYLLTSFFFVLFTKAKSQDTANFNFSIGINNTVSFINTSHLHGDAYRKAFWSFGNGAGQMTGPLGNALYQYTNAGSYTVCLKIYKYAANANDSVLTSDVCKTVSLSNTTPDSCRAHFTSSSSSSTAVTQLFIAQPWHNHEKKPEEICWIFGDGKDTCIRYNPSLSNNYAIYHNYVQPGQYKACVIIRYQGGCQSDYCQTVTVGGDLCKIDYTMEAVTASPLSRHFIAQPLHAQQKKPVRVCWDFGDGATECKQYLTSYNEAYAINHTYTKAGQFNVCVSVLFDGGCESKKCKLITIETPPPPVDSCFVNVYEVATNTSNLERHFYAGVMNRDVEKICWSFGDGRDTCITPSIPANTQSLVVMHRYQAPGVYRVCIKIRYAGGCEAERCREVAIRSASNVCGGYITDSVIDAKTIAFKGFGIQNPNDHVISWNWTFGDGTSASGQQINHRYALGGTYEVCLYIKTDLGCETKICKKLVIQGERTSNLQLIPNPVANILYASFQSSLQESVTISIYNANGILIKTFTRAAITGTNTWQFDVSGLPTGVYSLIISSPHQLANAIFFKQ